MKAIVGIDSRNAYVPAICLLGRLAFPRPAVTLLHAANPCLPFAPGFGEEAVLEAEYAKVMENLGRAALHDAVDQACSRDLHARPKMVYGNAADCLIREAEATKADLVAVNATHHGVWSTSFLGSVSRALAVGSHVSVLVAKGETPRRKPFRAVFATDHSAFAGRCLERFLELRPKGIDEIVVVSAWELDDHEAKVLDKNLASLGGDVDRWIAEAVQIRTEETCTKLREAGYAARALVSRGRPNDVIRQSMRDSQADLLIVGSQGKGAIERTLVGSVSLHQVVAEPYPVLVIRP